MPRSLVRAPVLALVLVAVALTAGVPSAAAVVRYASPAGDGTTSNCTSPDPMNANGPCTLERAVEVVAVDSDEVIVNPGDYNLGAQRLSIGDAINVHGADGQALPVISSSDEDGVEVNNAGAIVRRLRIEHSGAFRAFENFNSAMAEQIIAHTTTGFSACTQGLDEVLRDSVCWNTASAGIGLNVSAIAGGPFLSNIRNVTAVATGTGSYGVEVRSVNTNIEQTLVAKNVIADGVAADVHSEANSPGSKAEAILSSSNYATELEEPGPSGTAPITDPGTGVGNQTAAPLFTDAGAGLFHQAPGSPTIEAGAAVDLMGSADFDGDPRVVGSAPDIGADEFVPAQATPPPATPPPVSKPSNAFALGALTRNKKKGTATIKVNVPNPGELTASGNGVQAASSGRAMTSKSVGAGQAQLLVKARGKKKRKLKETGKVKLTVAVTYTPTGGDPATQSIKVKLKKTL